MKTFEELRTILEVNFKADHKKFHIATAKIKNTEIHYHQEKKGSKKVRVFVKPKSSKEHEELGVFRDMNQARKSAEQFVKLMGEDIDEGVSFLKQIVKKAKPDGEVIKEAVLQGKDYVFDKKKKKVVISKDNYKKVQRDSKTKIKGVPYIMYNMGNQGTVLAPVHFEEDNTMSVRKQNMSKVKPMLQKLAKARGVPLKFEPDGINITFKGKGKDIDNLMRDIEKNKTLMKLMESQ